MGSENPRTEDDMLIRAITLIPALFLFLPVRSVEARQDAAEGEKLFNSRCAACHFAPDDTIRRDQLWVQMINTTA